MSRTRSSGFTIIELLIATAVLSTILVLVTTMMINIGNLYYKGINQSRIQDNVRSISDEIAQQLKLSKIIPVHASASLGGFNTEAYCIGNLRYSFVVGKQLSKQIHHVLWRDNIATSSACAPANVNSLAPNSIPIPGTEGVELMAPNSRLLSFSVAPLTTPYTINVEEAYGDTDLLCDNGSGDCSDDSDSTHIWNSASPVGKVQCKGHKGEQFCATARLTTTVVQRIR